MKKRLHITVVCPENLVWDLEEGQKFEDVEEEIKNYLKGLMHLWLREEED